jgi:two-component SAPR family response regulator
VPSVLVLDDEPALTRLLVVTLERHGYDVRGFTRPLQALESLQSFVPDAIITDVSMPVMDGLEFCRQVRRDPRFAATPVIFLSALGERADIRGGMNVGADDYLTKPFSRAEILEALEVRLERAAPRRRALEAPALHAQAFGGMELVVQGAQVSWGSRKAAEFFFFLLEKDSGVTTWTAAEALWPDKDEQRASSVFHTTLHRLRRVLGDGVVQARNRRYFLNAELGLRYDVREYHALAQRARREQRLEHFLAAIELYRGEYLSGVDSAWCVEQRDALHNAHLDVLLEASRLAETQGDIGQATRFAQAATQHDPYNDAVWNALGRLYERNGDPIRADRVRARLQAFD